MLVSIKDLGKTRMELSNYSILGRGPDCVINVAWIREIKRFIIK